MAFRCRRFCFRARAFSFFFSSSSQGARELVQINQYGRRGNRRMLRFHSTLQSFYLYKMLSLKAFNYEYCQFYHPSPIHLHKT